MPVTVHRVYDWVLKYKEMAVPANKYSDEEEMEPAAYSALMMRLAFLQPYWNRYLVQGCFPELVKLQDPARAQLLLREDVVDKVLKRDVPALFDVRNSVYLEKIYLYLCLKSGNIINYAEMSKALGVTKPTLSRYIDYLRDAGLMISNPLSDSTDMGMMAETAVYKHFQNAYGALARVGYLRAGGKMKEVDVAVDFFPRNKLILCEAKYRNNSELSRDDALPTLCYLLTPNCQQIAL